jgi:hypothetical protein
MITLYDDNKGNNHLVNNVRHEANGHFRNKKREYLKAIINELETKSKNRYVTDKNKYVTDAYRHQGP